jgi:DNA (cytosine-5)-methyltransferase 1
MGFDSLKDPSRTVVTAEIGSTPSRMRHIFEHEREMYRRLMPIETERLNQFPDNWTKITNENGKQIPDSRRGFLMGNALVVGVIERLRDPLRQLIIRRS